MFSEGSLVEAYIPGVGKDKSKRRVEGTIVHTNSHEAWVLDPSGIIYIIKLFDLIPIQE